MPLIPVTRPAMLSPVNNFFRYFFSIFPSFLGYDPRKKLSPDMNCTHDRMDIVWHCQSMRES